MRWRSFVTAACALLLFCPPAFGDYQDGGRIPSRDKYHGKDCRLIWVKGEVTEVDWVGSKFSVRLENYGYGWWHYGYRRDYPEELRFFVSEKTEFIQRTDEVSFNRLSQSDDVSILFCRDYFIDPLAIVVVINEAY